METRVVKKKKKCGHDIFILFKNFPAFRTFHFGKRDKRILVGHVQTSETR